MTVPKGSDRGDLAEMGLIGKVAIQSNWDENKVQEEISSVFREIFQLKNGELLPFNYLG